MRLGTSSNGQELERINNWSIIAYSAALLLIPLTFVSISWRGSLDDFNIYYFHTLLLYRIFKSIRLFRTLRDIYSFLPTKSEIPSRILIT